jgi:hypothetical protein
MLIHILSNHLTQMLKDRKLTLCEQCIVHDIIN